MYPGGSNTPGGVSFIIDTYISHFYNYFRRG